jgi:hypothetical protein
MPIAPLVWCRSEMAKWKAIQAAGEAVGLGPTRLREIECKQALYHRITRRSDRAGDGRGRLRNDGDQVQRGRPGLVSAGELAIMAAGAEKNTWLVLVKTVARAGLLMGLLLGPLLTDGTILIISDDGRYRTPRSSKSIRGIFYDSFHRRHWYRTIRREAVY